NIFLVTDPAMPAGERIKVLDFGIAKLAQPQGTGVQTQSMMVFGTPRYMSPEQCRSAANIDHRSDIYALGCILFELVCGIPPFTGESGELIAKHQLLEPPEPRSLISDLPDHLDRLIQSMLAKQPGDRPQTMAEVQRSLQAGGAMSPGVAPTLLPDADPSASGRQPQAPRSLGRRPGSAPAAPIVDPRERSTANLRPASNPTTLSGAGGVWEPPPSKRRSGLIIAGVALAVIGVGGGWLALRDTSEPATPAQVQAAQPALPPPAPPADAAPAVAKDIELKLTSTPVAEVYLAADGRLLGETPYTHTLPRGTGKIVFLLKAEGHKDARITMAVDKDATEAIVLTANKPVTAAPAEPPSRPARPKSHPKPRTPATNAGSGSAGPAPKPPDDGMGGRI
ncbi:MAG: serine/threonine protein kinase, partial [Kofleriaceae bacterium]